MRALIVLAALACASPALAQPPPTAALVVPPNQDWRYNAFLVQQEEARQQAIAIGSRLTALDTELRAQRSIDWLQAARRPPILPAPDPRGGPPYPQIDASQLGAIPDSVLAASNRKVLEAAGGR